MKETQPVSVVLQTLVDDTVAHDQYLDPACGSGQRRGTTYQTFGSGVDLGLLSSCREDSSSVTLHSPGTRLSVF